MLSRSACFFNPDREILLKSFSNLAAIAIQNSRLLDRVRRGNEQLHALSQRLLKAQEEERLHLSRELHDESGQLLAAMMVQLGLLERHGGSLAVESSTEIQAHVKELKRTTTAIQEHLHTMAVNLRPASLDHVGLVTALQQYIKEFNRQYDLCVEFEATGMEDRRLPPEMETAIFRIVQESLTNVVLHAQASRVDIVLHRQNGTIVTVIDDDGVGFNPQSPTTENQLGLFGMRERVQMLGGRLTIESTPGHGPGHGTTVKVEVPCGD
jgi:signal transduction histidine kinase